MYEIVDSELIHDGFLKLYKYKFEINGEIVEREVIDKKRDSVCVLPYNEETNKVLLAEQFRPPIFVNETPYLGSKLTKGHSLEACAGYIDNKENAIEAVKREAKEELKVDLKYLKYEGEYYTNIGSSTEMMTLYTAEYRDYQKLDDTNKGGLAEEHEEIFIRELDLFDDSLRHDVQDMKTTLLLTILKHRHRKE